MKRTLPAMLFNKNITRKSVSCKGLQLFNFRSNELKIFSAHNIRIVVIYLNKRFVYILRKEIYHMSCKGIMLRNIVVVSSLVLNITT